MPKSKPSSTSPLQEELEEAYGDGHLAVMEGKDQSDCPVMAGALCIEWIKGWKSWHEEHNTEWWQEYGIKE